MVVKVDILGVFVIKVRFIEERVYIFKIIYCLLVYKCFNVYIYILFVYLLVGCFVCLFIYVFIILFILILYYLYINDF